MSWSGLREATEQATPMRHVADWPPPSIGDEDARFIALFNPNLVEALLDEVEAGRALATARLDGITAEVTTAFMAYDAARVRVDSLIEDKP